MCTSHHRPSWGNAGIQDVLCGQRDLYPLFHAIEHRDSPYAAAAASAGAARCSSPFTR